MDNNTDINKMADLFLKQIDTYFNNKFSYLPTYKPAEVLKVNTDGTVDVFFPPDKEKLFTKVQNQSIYQNLKVGDQVYLCYPNGNPSSCWISGKFKGGKVNFGIGAKDGSGEDVINYIEIDATGLEKIATTGNVNDLLQTPGDEIVINCGGAAR